MSGTIAQDCGISYRQLDYWCRCGYLHPFQADGSGRLRDGGTGHPRLWPDGELWVAREMGALVRAGLTPRAAHQVARKQRTTEILALLDSAA